MATLREKVENLLLKAFPRKTDAIYLDEDEDGIVGIVVSNRFRGMEMRDRTALMGRVLYNALTPEELPRVPIVTGITSREQRYHPDFAKATREYTKIQPNGK